MTHGYPVDMRTLTHALSLLTPHSPLGARLVSSLYPVTEATKRAVAPAQQKRRRQTR